METRRAIGPWDAKPTEAALAPSDTALAPARSPEAATPVLFDGESGAWSGLMARGLLLYIPTFGFYRFWLRTDQRRFLWRSISVEGERLEYRGTARELLVGFLIAIAIYLPITIAYTILGLYAETWQAFASLPLILFSVLLGYYASYRARRYRLTRTVFRGVRFWMDGSAWRFAFTALGWMLLTVLTLGVAWPWMLARLERIKMRHSHFGELQGAFHGTGGALLKGLAGPTIGLVLLALVPMVNLVAVPIMLGAIGVVIARWTLAGASFGPVRFANTMPTFALAVPALYTMLAMAGFAFVWGIIGITGLLLANGVLPRAGVLREVFDGDLAEILTSYATLFFGVGWMVIWMVANTFIKSVLYDFPKMRLLASHTALTNVGALEDVAARGAADGAFGEGLADALGSDGF